MIAVLRQALALPESQGVDLVYGSVDTLLGAGHFEEVTAILREAQRHCERPALSILLSLLTITLPYRDALGPEPSRLAEQIKISFKDGDRLVRGLE